MQTNNQTPKQKKSNTLFILIVVVLVLVALYYQYYKYLQEKEAKEAEAKTKEKVKQDDLIVAPIKPPTYGEKQISIEQFISNAYAGDFKISNYTLSELLNHDNRLNKIKQHLANKGKSLKYLVTS